MNQKTLIIILLVVVLLFAGVIIGLLVGRSSAPTSGSGLATTQTNDPAELQRIQIKQNIAKDIAGKTYYFSSAKISGGQDGQGLNVDLTTTPLDETPGAKKQFSELATLLSLEPSRPRQTRFTH
jgi:hypothetical protein